MTSGVSGFKSAQAAQQYQRLYDEQVATFWPVTHEELDVSSRFGTTRVRVSGEADGIPLLLVHPTAGSSAGWYPLIGPLCEDRRVYTPDTIGAAGRSVQTAPITSVGDLVTWLDEVLDALDLERVHIVGYSEGGWIAGSHAALTSRPDRVTTSTLIEPAGAIERVPTGFLVAMIGRGALTLLARDKPAAVRKFNRWMNGDVELTDAQVELVLAAMGSFRQKLPRPHRLTDDELRRITAPTLLLLGADTKLYDPAAVQERALRLIPTVEVEVIPDAGHGLAFQYPELVSARILEHVAPGAHPGTTEA
jgi:pimeloyl-ACP methyl ester carboxylesterase